MNLRVRCKRLKGGVLMVALGVSAVAGLAEPAISWPGYRTILWIGETVGKHPEAWGQFLERLREMGVNTGMVYGDADPRPWATNDFRYYVENVVNRGLCLKWNSHVRDWDAFVTGWSRTGRPESAFIREYCLDDSAWRAWAAAEVRRVAARNAPHAPVALNLRDELSVTISANPFDYDFGEPALATFRSGLRRSYGDVGVLNTAWGTDFKAWEEVRPFSTDRIKNRMAGGGAMPRGQPDWQALQRLKFEPREARRDTPRWNLAPWAEFRSHMDASLATVLGELRREARLVAPELPVGIEGTQMPHAFGGYNLWQLSQVLDWVEPYDIGSARAILGSFMQGKPILSTVFEKDTDHARRRLWHLLLEGDRGCIVWWSEDCLAWTGNGWELTPKAQALSPVLKELTSPLAALFLQARKERDPIAIVYSHPSVQVDWLLESTPDGSTWHRRFSSFEAEHNRMVRVREAWLKLLEDQGYSPWFVAAEMLPAVLASGEVKVLVLPQAYAMSDAEIRAVSQFLTIEKDRRVLADGAPGLFDERCRLREQGGLEPWFAPVLSEDSSRAIGGGDGEAEVKSGDVAQYASARLGKVFDPSWPQWMMAAMGTNTPQVVVDPSLRLRVHRFRVGRARLLGLERNISYAMSEDLRQAGGNEVLETAVEADVSLKGWWHAYDLRSGAKLGTGSRLRLKIGPWAPTLVALLPEPLPTGQELMRFLVSQDGAASGR